jgi:cytochrome c oxidase subunit 3
MDTTFNTTTTVDERGKRIHPHKFTMWVAMGSICMMFAGFTSAYIVKRNQSNFLEFNLPIIFWVSTVVILFSSLTIQLAVKSFKARERSRYKSLITITAFLGVLFAALQVIGFRDLESHGIYLTGPNSNAAASFILIIVGMHALHVLGGVVALLVMFIRAFASTTKNYSSTPIEIVSTYWHFVDVLWIYLVIFLIWIR